MDFLLDGLIKLSNTLTPSELFSLLLIIAVIVILTIKYTIVVVNYVKHKDESIDEPESSQIDQLLLTLHSINEKLIKIESEINEGNENKTAITYQLSIINEKLIEMKNQTEQQSIFTRDTIEKATVLIGIIKQTLEIHAESTEARSAENRSLHHSTLEQVNELSKDVAQLQGTLLGSLAGGRTSMK